MTTGTFFALGIMAGVMIAAWLLGKKKRKTQEYDEMQLKIRATGYQIGFFSALILLMGAILCSELGLFKAVTPAFAMFAVIMISVTIFAVYCILHDAFLGMNGSGKSYIFMFAAVTILNVIVTIRRMAEGEILENGVLTFSGGSSLLLSAGFLVILITLIIKSLRGGKEAEE